MISRLPVCRPIRYRLLPLGWELWRGPLVGRNESQLLPTPDQTGIMILRLARTPPLDLDGTLVIEYDGRFW
jgi:hypothetical protein